MSERKIEDKCIVASAEVSRLKKKLERETNSFDKFGCGTSRDLDKINEKLINARTERDELLSQLTE